MEFYLDQPIDDDDSDNEGSSPEPYSSLNEPYEPWNDDEDDSSSDEAEVSESKPSSIKDEVSTAKARPHVWNEEGSLPSPCFLPWGLFSNCNWGSDRQNKVLCPRERPIPEGSPVRTTGNTQLEGDDMPEDLPKGIQESSRRECVLDLQEPGLALDETETTPEDQLQDLSEPVCVGDLVVSTETASRNRDIDSEGKEKAKQAQAPRRSSPSSSSHAKDCVNQRSSPSATNDGESDQEEDMVEPDQPMTLARWFGCVDSPVPSEQSDAPDELETESFVLNEESATPDMLNKKAEAPEEESQSQEEESESPEEESELPEEQSGDDSDHASSLWGSVEYKDAAALSDSDDDYEGGGTAKNKPVQSSRITRSSRARPAAALVIDSEDDADDDDDVPTPTDEEEQDDRADVSARAKRVVLDSEDDVDDDVDSSAAVNEQAQDEHADQSARASSEMSWSESDVEGNDDFVQPTGEHLLVICRSSSGKDGAITKQRRDAESLDMGGRLKANCHDPAAVDFQSEEAIFFVRQSQLPSSFKKAADNNYTRPLRLWMDAHKDSTATVLIRSIDGLTTNVQTMKHTLWAFQERGITAQLIFQFNKVCDEICPIKLIPFRGLGSVTIVDSTTFLAHLENRVNDRAVARIVKIWQDLNEEKVLAQGIQDRNEVPPEDFQQAVGVSGISRSYGRTGQPLKALTHPSVSKSGRIPVADRSRGGR
ncbi:hypothetical protein N0V87_002085 [Didymella glomerata]|uniref:Uncharacterized protein n=1 Tax=Didymella glomerata TaxID=749621 RepID=A0A9W8X4Z3_9PLEO|nr:hypothetical protein N0V87_002085 [Didymella glomerata]